ncbi:MAG: hypothetical protein AMXMBFR58_30110 [Phycisphaerae bacterium]|nr:hypothetical protein [Phycisphaerales bacterium]MCK6476010.1 hypothetical protein [Phycisphaerales bacterium]
MSSIYYGSHPGSGSFGTAIGSIGAGALNIVAPGAGSLLSSLTGMEQSFESLFQQQMALQRVTTEQQMRTNMSKTISDTNLSAVRNMRS